MKRWLNKALGGIAPMQKLALAAWLHFWRPLKMGGLSWRFRRKNNERY